LAAAQLAAAAAYADLDLRVQPWPVTGPIDAYARVTTEGGETMAGLTADDFAVTLDGQAVDDFAFGLPPDQDPAQRVSWVLVVTDPTGVQAFLSQLALGDYVSIVTFRDDRMARFAPIDVQPFTQIDAGTGTDILGAFLQDVYRRDPEDTRPATRDLSLAFQRAREQFEAPGSTLPDGPKAIVLVKAAFPYSIVQQSDVVASANSTGLPIFTIYADKNSALTSARFASVAEVTGGIGFPVSDAPETSQALVTLRRLLNESYRLRIQALAAADCNPHLLEISVQGQTESIAFTPCDTTPDDPDLGNKTEVPLATLVVSDPVTITGIEGAVPVQVFDGEFSIGCGPAFTSEPGLVLPGERICVRHMSGQFHNEPVYSSIVVGGVASVFGSTAESPPSQPPPLPPTGGGSDGGADGGANGGGGSIGLLELLLALGAGLFARRSPDRSAL
jgi:hypothetical protein